MELGNNPFEIAFWMRRGGNLGVRQLICGKVNAAGFGTDVSWYFDVDLAGTGLVRFQCGNGAGATAPVSATTPISTSNPNGDHIRVVRTDSNVLKLFINGVQEGGDVPINFAIANNSSPIVIGQGGSYASNSFIGWIDEFSLEVL